VAKHPAANPFRNVGWVHLEAFDSLGASSAKGGHVFRASQGLSAADGHEGFSNTGRTPENEFEDAEEPIDWPASPTAINDSQVSFCLLYMMTI
jgi:hypothetical protein